MKSVETLQSILMLKYLNFSLDEVRKILDQEDTKETFKQQAKLLRAQKDHLEQVLKAVEEMQQVKGEAQWEKMLMIIRMTQQKEEVIKQYKTSDNLEKRINIHAYSTSKTSWYQWILEGLQLRSGMKILEIGCGNGMLWTTMGSNLPRDLHIIMTDSSVDMLQTAKGRINQNAKLFEDRNIQFTFLQKDAEEFYMEEKGFDRIIANHMLYHVSEVNRQELLQTCAIILKENGMFFASTVGNTHLRELFSLIKEFDGRIDMPNWMTANFELENGSKQLEKVFSKVTVEVQENDLLVPNPQAIYDYVDSMPGNVKEVIKVRSPEFLTYLKSKVSDNSPFFIHKSTGAFKAYK